MEPYKLVLTHVQRVDAWNELRKIHPECGYWSRGWVLSLFRKHLEKTDNWEEAIINASSEIENYWG